MNQELIIKLRKEAEKSVAEMPDGDLKVKAFEVVLSHLLTHSTDKPEPKTTNGNGAKNKTSEGSIASNSTGNRILSLREEDFFKLQRTLREILEELDAHGWHYSKTDISGVLKNLVQKKQLRRKREPEGKKKVWKYSNY